MNKLLSEANRGSIEVIYGPMFSGKTTELLRIVRKYKAAGRKVLLLKHNIDNRYSDDMIVTHDKDRLSCLTVSYLPPLIDIIKRDEYEVVGIDEGQFHSNISSFCLELMKLNVVVVVATLDNNFKRDMFPETINLISIADRSYKLTAICFYCKKDAPFTMLYSGNKDQICQIGGSDKFRAVCRYCYDREYVA